MIRLCTILLGLAAFASLPGRAADRPQLQGGVLFEQAAPNVVLGNVQTFIREAANRPVGVIETAQPHALKDGGGQPSGLIYRRWSFVDDFARCASAVSVPHLDRDAALEIVDDPFLSGPDQKDQLAHGRCLIGRRVDKPLAAYRVRVEGAWATTASLETASGQFIHYLGLHENDIWAAFGRPPSGGASYSAVPYEERRPVTDAELVRALGGPPKTQDAALWVLRLRLEPNRLAYESGAVRELRPTGLEVGKALLDSGLLLSRDRNRRSAALDAAAVFPDLADRLGPQVLQALREPMDPWENGPDPIMRRRVAERAPERPESLKPLEAKRGLEDAEIVGSAAFTAARLGKAVSSEVWTLLEPELRRDRWLAMLADDTIPMLARKAGAGHGLAREWLADPEAAPALRSMAERMVEPRHAPEGSGTRP
jgi:hypothetical protein